MKKLFSRCSWLITVLICLGILFSVKTFAKDSAADDSLSGSLGKNITWTLEGSSDSGYTIRISGSGDTPDYDYISDIPWYSHINEIKSVVVEEGITGLGKSSFYKSTSIQSVKLADSVRSIGEMCFFRNGSLEKIELGNGLTSIGEAAFSVSNLKKVSLPIGITHIESDTFYGCKQLESINLEHVKSIGRRAFYICSNLSGIHLSTDLQQLEYAAFRGCSSIDKVNIGSKLSELNEQVFAECSSLKEIYIPDNITAIQRGAFYECTALGQVTGAKNVEVLGEMAFNSAKALKTYPFGNKVRSIGNSAFSGCSSFKIDKIPDSVTFMGTWAFGSTAIETIEFGSGLTYINSYAFSYCSNLTKVTLPANMQSIKIYAFSHCPKLKNVIFTEGLKTINEGAFTGSIIKEAVIPKSVSAIGSRAFPDSTKLTLLNDKLTNMGGNTYKVIHKAKASFYYNYDYAYEVLELVNKIRKENNLEPVTMDVDLLDNAMYRASELALYFSHQSPMGFTAIGTTENCALGQKTPQKVVDAWMSDEHKYPILSSDFTAIGIGAVESNGQLHWTQEFLSKVSEEAMQSSYKNGNQINTIKYTTDIVNNFYPEQELVKIKEKGNSSIVSILKRAVLLPDSVHYVSSDEKVCTVSKDGKLTGKEAGNATITIYAADSADEYALQTTVQVEVQHNWQSKYTIDKEPTCTENGSQSIHCDVCNAINQDRVGVIKATGHKWSAWEVTKEASETEEGSRRRVCENDATHMEIEVIPVLAHVHKLMKVEAKKATCTEDGNKEYYVCSSCKKLFADADIGKEINKEDTVVKATGHKVVKDSAVPATTTTTGLSEGSHCSVCGQIIVAQKVIPKKDVKGDVNDSISVNDVEKKITANRNDGDIAGSTFKILQLRAKKTGRNYINLSWTKVKGASGYIIYGNRCNSNGKVYPLRKVISTAKVSQKMMKLKKGTYYKYVVIAYKMTGAGQKVIASSKTIHVATAGGKVGNYKKVKLNKEIVKLKCGKVFKIKAEQVPEKKKLKVKRHRGICFESSNSSIATVSSSGKVKAKKKGICVIYIYSQSGTFSKMTVRVK